MKYLLPLLCISLTCCSPKASEEQTRSSSAQPTTESIEKLLILSGIESSTKRDNEFLVDMLSNDMGMEEAGEGFATKTTSWKAIKPLYIQAYKEIFKQSEIDDLIKLYQSPAGKMLVKKQPAFDKKLMMLHKQNLKEALPDFQKDIEKVIEGWKHKIDGGPTKRNIKTCLHLCDIYYQEHRNETPSFEIVMAQAYNNMRESRSDQETQDYITKRTKDSLNNDLIFSHSKEGDDLIMTLLSLGQDQKLGTNDDLGESVRIKGYYAEQVESPCEK